MTHAWCRDPSRDERVRAAEDGRAGPLPTLEQCIEQAKQAAMTAGVKKAFIQSDTGWVPLTREHLHRLEQMIPKIVSASSAVEHENKGDGMGVTESLSEDEGGEEMEQGNFAHAAERSVPVSNTGETQSGLRTERVTLEITHFSTLHAEQWGWRVFVQPCLRPGESVRVVDTHAEAVAESVAWEGARDAYRGRILRLTEERDAAIRERESWKLLADRTNERLSAAEARVAELEAASGGGEQPRGWLTEEEREAVEASREFWQVECESTLGDDTDRRYLAALSNLLARSSPPEVVLPCSWKTIQGELVCLHREVIAALAAAGVEVEEVGRE